MRILFASAFLNQTLLNSIITNREIHRLNDLNSKEVVYIADKLKIDTKAVPKRQLRSKIAVRLLKSDETKLTYLRDKLRMRIKEGWEESRFCDIFKTLPLEDLKNLAILYEITDNTEDAICKKLEEIFIKKKQEYSKCNTIDPLSGKHIAEIGLQRTITFEQDGVVCCFEIQSLNDYVNSNNKINPYTDTRFTPENIAYVKREYSKHLDLLFEKGNYLDFSYYPSSMLLAMTYLSSKYDNALYLFTGVDYDYGMFGPLGSFLGSGKVDKSIHNFIIKFIMSNKQKMMLPVYLPGHANMLMFSKTKNGITCERYEPGYSDNIIVKTFNQGIDAPLKEIIQKYPIKYISQDELGCIDGPQSTGEDPYGFCQTYSMIHADRSLAEPELNTKEIMEKYPHTYKELDEYIAKVYKFSIQELKFDKENVSALVNFNNIDYEKKIEFVGYMINLLEKKHDVIPEININRLMQGTDAESEIMVSSLITFLDEADITQMQDKLQELNKNIIKYVEIDLKISSRRSSLIKLSDAITRKIHKNKL